MNYTLSLPRTSIAALLASFYILGFIITPYWIIPESTTGMIFFLGLITVMGITWLALSSDSLRIQFNARNCFLVSLLLIGIVALNFRALNSVIPYLGDEGLHIDRTLELATRTSLGWGFGVLGLFVLLFYSAIKKPKWAVFAGILIVSSVVILFLNRNPFADIDQPLFFLRYPFINYWFFAALPKLASFVASPYHEILFRVIPVLSMAGVILIFQKSLGFLEILINLTWGFAAATIPIIFYYSSILYIDPPAVFLMTIVCLHIKSLIHEDSRKITQTPGWYALILMGFIKETTIPFLLCVLAFRVFIQLRNWYRSASAEGSEKPFAGLAAGELGIIFSTLAPVFLYLFFRTIWTSTRSFSIDISNLSDPAVYQAIGKSFVEQFGLFLIFFLGGGVLLIKKREYPVLFFHLSLILIIPLFYVIDSKGYAGYSRFNLFVLPPILAGSSIFIREVFVQRRTAGAFLACAAVFFNLLNSPVYLDGTKVPYWGNYLTDTSEHYYPYQDALIWLKNNHNKGRMLFTGLDYQYSFQFYWNKLGWHPKRDGMQSEGIDDEAIAIARILEKAEREKFDTVVYRVLESDFLPPQDTGPFQIKIIRNSAHVLIIYYKTR